MVQAKKNARAAALKEAKHLYKKFGFAAGKIKGALTKGRTKSLAKCEALLVKVSEFYSLVELSVMQPKSYYVSLYDMNLSLLSLGSAASNYLNKLLLDILKINQSFVGDID